MDASVLKNELYGDHLKKLFRYMGATFGDAASVEGSEFRFGVSCKGEQKEKFAGLQVYSCMWKQGISYP